MTKNKRVSYYIDSDVGSFSYGLGHVMKPHRIKMAHSLISSYGLLPKLDVLRPVPATAEQMTKFHSDEYVHFLKRVTPDTAGELSENGTKFLTGMDNPAYEGAFEFCSISAGGSISGAQRLATGGTDVAINWAGGLHHAKKNGASGFCYINDIVLGILELLRTYPRVLYVDVDCHHGDAVEEAFYTTDRVMTCSLHKFGDFFPGTGLCDDRGVGKGFRYSINVPFRSGLNDENFHSIYQPLMDRIVARFCPSVVVLQCGADSLAGDRLGQYNISMDGHADCVRYFMKTRLPLMVLGGGGYTIRNVAKTWAYETACVLGVEKELDKNIPYNRYFEYFGPEYKLEVPPSNMDDLNESDKYLEGIKETVLRQADEIPIAPSVGIHMPPRHSVAEELGLGLDGRTLVEGDYDDIDLRIQEIATEFLNSSRASENSETESDNDPSRWANDIGDNSDDESRFGTPTRRRKAANGNFIHRPSSRMNGNGFVHGTIPMPSPALLFSSAGAEERSRPPDSMGSVFGGHVIPRTGSPMEMSAPGLESLGIVAGAEHERVDVLMENGGTPTGRYQQLPAAEDNTNAIGGKKNNHPAPRRRFFNSGIRLRGLNEVQFPLSVLNGPASTSWGPAGFGGFNNEGHVMKRGFGFSYGATFNPNAGAGVVPGLEADNPGDGGAGAPPPVSGAGRGGRTRESGRNVGGPGGGGTGSAGILENDPENDPELIMEGRAPRSAGFVGRSGGRGGRYARRDEEMDLDAGDSD